ncbi:unnamed protein product, partial [Phaeothamnion confervicola]
GAVEARSRNRCAPSRTRAVHLPGQQTVVCKSGASLADIVSHGELSTTLTAWFLLNATDPDAVQLLYHEVPAAYAFDQTTRSWQRWRQREGFGTVRRMYVTHPGEGERYYFRVLLHHGRPRSDARPTQTYDASTAPPNRRTFEEACRRRRLLLDDREWNECMTEAAMLRMPHQLSDNSFSRSCATAMHPQQPEHLWSTHRDARHDRGPASRRAPTPKRADFNLHTCHVQRRPDRATSKRCCNSKARVSNAIFRRCHDPFEPTVRVSVSQSCPTNGGGGWQWLL